MEAMDGQAFNIKYKRDSRIEISNWNLDSPREKWVVHRPLFSHDMPLELLGMSTRSLVIAETSRIPPTVLGSYSRHAAAHHPQATKVHRVTAFSSSK